MDIRLLRYALTLAEELHFGRAAKAHFIAPQQFGRRIQELENDLGVVLFERTTRRVALTEAGERFMPRARRAVADVDALKLIVERERTDRVLRVGILGYGLADLWPSVRSILARRHPDVAISYSDLTWENQYDAVRTGEVDVAILHYVGGADDLKIEEVMSDTSYAVVPAFSEFADAPRLTMADLIDHPSVTPVGQAGLLHWETGQTAASRAQVRSPSNIPNAVAATGYVGIHAEPARRYLAHPEVRYVPLEGPPAVVAVATRPRDNSDPVAAFRASVHESVTLHGLRHDYASGCDV
jgi:DNA-binding transcriptional LysR family regulator